MFSGLPAAALVQLQPVFMPYLVERATNMLAN